MKQCVMLAPAGGVAATAAVQAQLHPNTPLTLPGAWQGLGDTQGFGGAAALMRGASAEVVEAAADKLRWWAEGCDELQGGPGEHEGWEGGWERGSGAERSGWWS